MQMKTICAALLAVSCLGCSTELSGWRGSDIPTGEKNAAYQLYFLPQLELKISVTRKLVKCGAISNAPDQKRVGNVHARADKDTVVDVAVEVEPTFVADETRPIAVAYEELDRPVSQISLSLERYENKTLKSINASVQDKSAQTASNVFAGLATIAKALPLGVLASSRGATVCNEGTEIDVAAQENLTRNIVALERKLAQALAPADGQPSDPYTDEQKKLIKEIKEQIKSAKDSLGPIQERLTTKDVQTWTPAGFDSKPAALLPSDGAFKKWFRIEATPEAKAPLSIHVSIDRIVGPSPIVSTHNTSALIYRDPARARIRVCAETTCQPDAVERSVLLLAKDVDFPQGGVDVPLRLHNSPFDDTTLVATFSASGALMTFKYESAAELERMSTAFKEGAASAAGAIEAIEKKQDTKK